jgi:hypothetical protein
MKKVSVKLNSGKSMMFDVTTDKKPGDTVTLKVESIYGDTVYSGRIEYFNIYNESAFKAVEIK